MSRSDPPLLKATSMPERGSPNLVEICVMIIISYGMLSPLRMDADGRRKSVACNRSVAFLAVRMLHFVIMIVRKMPEWHRKRGCRYG